MKTLIKIAVSSIVGFTLAGTGFPAEPTQAQTNHNSSENTVRPIANRADLLRGIEADTSELNLVDDYELIDEDAEEIDEINLFESDIRLVEQDLGMWENSLYWENRGDVEDYAVLVEIYDF